MLIMTRFHRYYANHAFPLNWLVFLPLLALVGFVSAAVATAVVYWLLPPSARTGVHVSDNIRISTLITIIIGVVAYTYRKMKTRLETQNITLQQEVQNSSARLEQQEKELEIAREIQAGLIPKDIPQLDELQIVASWRPARAVGGDYFDVIKLNDHRMAICIADVVGKGIAAALLMANVQAAVKAFTTPAISPADMCTRLNQALCSNLASGKFVTFFFCVVDTEAKTLTYCNAGHCLPLLAHATGKLDDCGEGGTVLGIFPDSNYENGILPLEPGDKFLLFTDGISEAINPIGEEYGEARLREKLLASSGPEIAALHRELMKEVSDYCTGDFADDATVVLVSFTSSAKVEDGRSVQCTDLVVPRA